MGEFKQIEPLCLAAFAARIDDNPEADFPSVEMYRHHRGLPNEMTYASYEDAVALHTWLSRALGLPDVAELQRENERLRSERDALLAVLEPAEGLTLADNVRDASNCVENGDWWDGRKQFVMELRAAATALEAALKGVKT